MAFTSSLQLLIIFLKATTTASITCDKHQSFHPFFSFHNGSRRFAMAHFVHLSLSHLRPLWVLDKALKCFFPWVSCLRLASRLPVTLSITFPTPRQVDLWSRASKKSHHDNRENEGEEHIDAHHLEDHDHRWCVIVIWKQTIMIMDPFLGRIPLLVLAFCS